MGKYYVYHLIDPRDSKPFYVGKGTGNRVGDHESEARRGVSSVKCNKIREIWAAELPVERHVIRLFDLEAEALAFESAEIKRLGDTLTNIFGHYRIGLDPNVIRFVATVAHNSDGFRQPIVIRQEIRERYGSVGVGVADFFENNAIKFAKDYLVQMVKESGIERVAAKFQRYGITAY